MQQNLFTNKVRQNAYDKAFLAAYNLLNARQKEAVDTIEGPVMVIAGPGTGKTQVLAVRIGKILRDTQTQPHNILCLTFTDSASISMRKRLVNIIGPTAHQVHIFTFHAFCNQVIKDHSLYFGGYKELEVVSDLERVELVMSIFDELDGDHLLKNWKNVSSFEIYALVSLFDLMKKEHLDPERFKLNIQRHLDERLADQSDRSLYYQINRKPNKKGDLKKEQWEKLVGRFDKTRAAVDLFPVYQEKLATIGRYDYYDMILWVMEAFEKDDDLLGEYQERYHYFLVDEFQDTNGSQKDILEYLIRFWPDNPNVFVVGDDDQAIFKFQGANLSNITELYQKYHPQVVVLEENYRSTQPILDAAHTLITQNTERLVNDPDAAFTKDLVAANPLRQHVRELPVIAEYPHLIHEQAYLADVLTKAYAEKENLDQTAIIYRKHSQVDQLLKVLDTRAIPYNVRRDIDILTLPLVDCILTILRYIQSEFKMFGSGEERLYQILHYHFFRLPSSDNAKIALECGKRTPDGYKLIRQAIGDQHFMTSIGIQKMAGFVSLHDKIDKWVSDIVNETLQGLFQNILNEGEILAYIMGSAERTWWLQVLNSLFDFIKDETTKNPELQLENFLDMVDRMKSNNIALRLNRIVHSTGGAHFITAHSAKGMEFDQVYILGATADIWDNKRSSNRGYAVPGVIKERADSTLEDERRLFFVALTRARTSLEISYALCNNKNKQLTNSRFVDEVEVSQQVSRVQRHVDVEHLNAYQLDLFSKAIKTVKLIDKDRLDAFLEGFRMSITALNKYLKCPLSFYFEIVLRVPTARTKYMGFGRAVHDALRDVFIDASRGTLTKLESFKAYFDRGMQAYRSHFTPKELTDMTAYGHKILEQYHQDRLSNLDLNQTYYLEENLDHAEFDGVPLKGFLDKVEGKSKQMKVTDYKTGNPDNSDTRKRLQVPSQKNESGGDYWRQIVFYKILADSDKKHDWYITEGCIDFIEPSKADQSHKQYKYIISEEDVAVVGSQIRKVWDSIKNYEFQDGCDEDNCKWCNFVKSDFVYLDIDDSEELEPV